ncbi:MAG: class I SAM-dependent methyltransferase [Candidatus Kapaibacterium sp.]|jgi:SAM-dependent methyltransferase
MASLAPATQARLKILETLKSVTEGTRYYFGYQFGLGKEYIVPYLKANGVEFKGKAVCEIGCGEGGVLAAIADEGVRSVLGIDIRQEAIDRAVALFDHLGINPEHGIETEFDLHNITADGAPPKWKEKFDFVTLRDVIEHLDETEISLRNVMEFLKPGGYLYIVFPPYYSPFGAHQHLLKTLWGKLPWLQMLPNTIFNPLTSKAVHEIDIEEVSRLREIRLTIKKFKTAAKRAGLELKDEQLYLLRPVFKMKFGINPIRGNFLKHLPGLRELGALEASYLLQKPR